jgi:plasmid stabilization system protein ParE
VTPRIVFRPQAESETLDARAWYEERRRGLGEEFAIAVDETVANILEHPFAYPPSVARRVEQSCGVFRMQFTFVRYDEIVVLAVTHGRRDARHWQVRR